MGCIANERSECRRSKRVFIIAHAIAISTPTAAVIKVASVGMASSSPAAGWATRKAPLHCIHAVNDGRYEHCEIAKDWKKALLVSVRNRKCLLC